MSPTDLIPLLPILTLAVFAVIGILIIAFRRDHRAAMLLTAGGFALALGSAFFAHPTQPRQITPLFIADSYASFYSALILITGLIITLLSYNYLRSFSDHQEEYYVLLLLAGLGALILVMSDHFASFFLGLETLSVSLYTLIAYPHFQKHRIEASIKYLILAEATAAFMLFGMALVYSVEGTLSFAKLSVDPRDSTILLAGWGLLTVGIGFKLALVPFHFWTPDVYQGAPAPVTALIATVSKGAVFALMLRYFTRVNFYDNTNLWQMFALIAILSMLFGNLLALFQKNLKRILAYSSISHLGYLMVAFLASGAFAPQAVAFYFVAYFITTLCAFGVITLLSSYEKEMEDLAEYRGLYKRHPRLAIILGIAMLSLAGLPPTAGLVGKIYLAGAGVSDGLWALLIVLVISSIIGVFYYMRVLYVLFRAPAEEKPRLQISQFGRAILLFLLVLLVGLGLYPAPLMKLVTLAVTGLR